MFSHRSTLFCFCFCHVPQGAQAATVSLTPKQQQTRKAQRLSDSPGHRWLGHILPPRPLPAARACAGTPLPYCAQFRFPNDLISCVAGHVRGCRAYCYQPVSICWGAVRAAGNVCISPAAALRCEPRWNGNTGHFVAGKCAELRAGCRACVAWFFDMPSVLSGV